MANGVNNQAGAAAGWAAAATDQKSAATIVKDALQAMQAMEVQSANKETSSNISNAKGVNY